MLLLTSVFKKSLILLSLIAYYASVRPDVRRRHNSLFITPGGSTKQTHISKKIKKYTKHRRI